MKRRIKSKPIEPQKIVKLADVVMVLLLLIILLISYLAYREGVGYMFIIWAPLSAYIAVFYLYLVNLLKQQNQELTEQNKKLILANQRKSEFVYNCTHQLRTPLTTIKGAIDLMLDKAFGETNPQQERFLFNIDKSLEQLNGLVCNLLDHSMMTSGRQELEIRLTNIPILIEDVLTFLKPAAIQKNITLESNIPKDISDIPADADRIRQVLTDLIDNAIKFTPDEGKITIQVKEWGDCLQVGVMNTGKGLPKDDYDRIFDEFFKTAPLYEGQGLGLALAKGIVEAHGGEIWAEGEPDKGSTFYFTLPKETKALDLLQERREISKFLTPTLTLLDYIDQNILQRIQDNFTEAIGMSVSILDLNGNPVTKSVELNKFCSLIHGCPEGKNRCRRFSIRIENDSLRDNRPKAYYCFAGLAHFVAPIIVENTPMGSIEIVGAQIFSPIDHKRIKIISDSLGIDPDELMEAASDIKRFPENRIYAAGELLHSIAKTISSLCTQEHELTHKVAELSTIAHIGKAITSTLDLDKLLDLILYTTITVLEGDSGSIMFIDKERDELYVKAGYGMTKEAIKGKKIKIGKEIAGYVAKENKPLMLTHNIDDPHFVNLLHKEGLKSAMSIPLVLKNEVVGVFNVHRSKGRDFTEDDLNMFSTLALQSTIVIEEAQLYQALEHKASELTTFSKIGKIILSTLGIERVLNLVVEAVSEVMNTKLCVLRLVDKKENKLLPHASIGLNTKELQLEEKFAISSAQERKPIVCADVKKEQPQPGGFKPLAQENITSLLTVPLTIRERVIGTISVLSVKPYQYSSEDIELLSTFADQSSIAIENAGLFEAVRKGLLSATQDLSQAIDLKDAYIGGHSEEKARYAYEIANELGLSEVSAENIKLATLLHDVGKIGIPEEILLKPGGLTDEEFEVVKKHPLISTEILKSISFPKEIIYAIRHHHERLDSRGYPDGLSKDEIPREALIIEAVDAYGAMTKDRPYRKALTKEEAAKELKNGAGTQFDPEVVSAFLKVLKKEKV
ncbi:MAG: PocR ligand-binding domain-containing protein [bacterium]|nr:PocR ligand-binding domain-containing protein [bacterium]